MLLAPTGMVNKAEFTRERNQAANQQSRQCSRRDRQRPDPMRYVWNTQLQASPIELSGAAAVGMYAQQRFREIQRP